MVNDAAMKKQQPSASIQNMKILLDFIQAYLRLREVVRGGESTPGDASRPQPKVRERVCVTQC